MGKTLSRGTVPHRCSPPNDKVPLSFDGTTIITNEIPPLGTIWRCDCGRLWGVVRQPYVNVFPNRQWARAGLWARLKWMNK